MDRFLRMSAWTVRAFFCQRFKGHGARASTKHSIILALMGFHIGMGWIGAWTDPTYWLIRRGRSQ